MQTNLRHWEYYNMTDTFTRLYESSKKGKNFSRLYDLIISRDNILLAYRTIKNNKGSQTAGTDGKTIEDIKKLTDDELINNVLRILSNYQPKKVKRVMIPKHNGDERPLGIPCIMDRIIQQCIKQILEPICEAKFYNHSYGFRPLRSTHHALARVQHLINRNNLHFAVDIDIKGFFDNVNHTKLIKQMWNMGIRDRKLLAIVMKMLKSEIHGEGIQNKGTPQGGILSPLLSNIVLNDLDNWVCSQWESFPSRYTYSNNGKKSRALKQTNLKEGFIVRYADDFKIMCRDYKSAEKWYYAVKLFLKDRLGLDVNEEKSSIVNLRKSKTRFLGFTIRANKKSSNYVAITGIDEKKKQQIKDRASELIKQIKKYPTAQNALLFNTFILGTHNYFKIATNVTAEFSNLGFDLSKLMYNSFKNIGIKGIPKEPPDSYKKFYKNNFTTYKISNVWLYPVADIKSVKNMNFSQEKTIFNEKGRKLYLKEINDNILYQIRKMMYYDHEGKYSVEYIDNKISRYSMVKGKCEITGNFLLSNDVNCHHIIPLEIGGTDNYSNLKIVHKDIHKLIHATKKETIDKYMSRLNLNENQLEKINQLRNHCRLELINNK